MQGSSNNGMAMGGGGMSFALVADAEGHFPTPFPYLNPFHPFWLGADKDEGEDEQGDTGGDTALLDPEEPEDGGGEEADPDEDDNDDEGDGFFGIGHWFPKILVGAPAPTLMPA